MQGLFGRMRSTKDIVIVGAGPAGIAASIQLKRMGHQPLLFERDRVGGLLWNANRVENYPGFPRGINGPRLIHLFEKQLEFLGIKPEIAHIQNIINDEDRFLLQSTQGNIFGFFVIIATGTRPREIPLDLQTPVRSRLHQDLRNLLVKRGKHILIIGGGEAALDQAINLSQYNRVTIINRQAQWKAFPRLVEWVESIPQITCIHNTSVYNIALQTEGRDESRAIMIANAIENETHQFKIEADEVLFAIGREPEMELCKGLIQNQHLFFCGDVQNANFRQVSIAVGDGIKAAMKIHQMLVES
jgi:thioredoxin reductase (NADPH)